MSDAVPQFSIGDAEVVEGASGTRQVQFVVRLSQALAHAATVNWATADAAAVLAPGARTGAATAGSDYTAASGTLAFAAGTTTATIAVDVAGDGLVELDEVFLVNLSGAVGAAIGAGEGRGLIRNDDAPLVSVSGGAVAEGGAGGRATLPFTVRLSAPTTETVTVSWRTVDGTALAGTDYEATSGTLTFAPGETSRTVAVAVIGDAAVEPDETVRIELSAPVGAGFPPVYAPLSGFAAPPVLTASGTIRADDLPAATAAAMRLDLDGAVTTGFAASADGTRLALTGTTAGGTDLFVRAATGPGPFVRVAAQGESLGEGWTALPGATPTPRLSADGGHVAYLASRPAGPGATAYDVFVETLATGAVRRVGIGADAGTPSALRASFSLSADGRKVAFVSAADGLVPGDGNGGADLFVRDLDTGAVTLASRDATGRQLAGSAGPLPYADPVLSPDGTKLAFTSTNPALPGAGALSAQVFVKDLVTGALTLVSAASDGTAGSAGSGTAVFSPDGGRIAFLSTATNLSPAVGSPAGPAPLHVWVKDLATGALQLASSDAAGTPGHHAPADPVASPAPGRPVFSADGRRLAFASGADNLVVGDANGVADIFVKDLATGAVQLVGGPGGVAADGASGSPAFLADGTVAFLSAATTLTAGDTDGATDLFRAILLSQTALSVVASGADRAEGRTGTTPFAFTVTRAGDLTVSHGVSWSVAGSGAAPASADDFAGGVLPSGMLTFAPGEAARTITVSVAGDWLVEADEGFTVTLAAPTGGAVLAVAGASGTIRNDDAPPDRVLAGTDGADRVLGGPGDDVLLGGAGDDILEGGGGSDVYDGGAGRDTARLPGVALRSGTFAVLADGDVTFAHGGDVSLFRGIEVVEFVDGRMVFDTADPAAQVARLYRAGLGRAPEQGGLNFWIDQVQGGVPLSSLADGFVASQEFKARFGDGLDDVSFVTRIYVNVLDRAPDGGGLDFWVGRLAAGGGRGGVLAAISESAENQAVTRALVQAGIWDLSEHAAQVARLYDTALGRLPDAGGLAYWRGAIDAGTATLSNLADAFVGSAEFQATYGALSNRAFVELVYRNTLDRPGEAGGVDFWTSLLDGGRSRTEVVLAFSESAEHAGLTQAAVMNDDPQQFGILFAG